MTTSTSQSKGQFVLRLVRLQKIEEGLLELLRVWLKDSKRNRGSIKKVIEILNQYVSIFYAKNRILNGEIINDDVLAETEYNLNNALREISASSLLGYWENEARKAGILIKQTQEIDFFKKYPAILGESLDSIIENFHLDSYVFALRESSKKQERIALKFKEVSDAFSQTIRISDIELNEKVKSVEYRICNDLIVPIGEAQSFLQDERMIIRDLLQKSAEQIKVQKSNREEYARITTEKDMWVEFFLEALNNSNKTIPILIQSNDSIFREYGIPVQGMETIYQKGPNIISDSSIDKRKGTNVELVKYGKDNQLLRFAFFLGGMDEANRPGSHLVMGLLLKNEDANRFKANIRNSENLNSIVNAIVGRLCAIIKIVEIQSALRNAIPVIIRKAGNISQDSKRLQEAFSA